MLDLKPHPALLIIDMQNGFCHKEGSFRRVSVLDIATTQHLTNAAKSASQRRMREPSSRRSSAFAPRAENMASPSFTLDTG